MKSLSQILEQEVHLHLYKRKGRLYPPMERRKPLVVGTKLGKIWLWVLAQQEPCCMVHWVWCTLPFSIHSGKMCLAFTWIYKCRIASVITMNGYKGKCPGINSSTWSSTMCQTHINAWPLLVFTVDRHKSKWGVLTHSPRPAQRVKSTQMQDCIS